MQYSRMRNPALQPDAMRVAVTGGSGFVGTRLIERLVKDGFHVKALYHKQKPPCFDQINLIQGSLNDPETLLRLVEGVDAVIHCGGLVAARRDSDFYNVNGWGTSNLFSAATLAQVPRFLLISSLAARLPGISPYAGSKKQGEDFLTASQNLNWDIIRPPAVYGPDDRQILPIFKLLQKKIALLPAGRQARISIIHVDDLVDAIMAWLKSGMKSGSIYEIDDGRVGGHLWQGILQTASDQLGVKSYGFSPPRFALLAAASLIKTAARLTGQIPFMTPGKIKELSHNDWVCQNSSEFTEISGWEPEISLQKGIADTICSYRNKDWL